MSILRPDSTVTAVCRNASGDRPAAQLAAICLEAVSVTASQSSFYASLGHLADRSEEEVRGEVNVRNVHDMEEVLRAASSAFKRPIIVLADRDRDGFVTWEYREGVSLGADPM